MRLLAIETSTPGASVALVEDATTLAAASRIDPVGHATFLVPAIDFCFDQVGWSPSALDAVAVDIGPGLYTGIRVGVATAQGLAAAFGIPIIPAVSTDAIALEARTGHRLIWTVVDVRRGELAVARYQPVPGGVVRTTDPELVKPEVLRAQLDSAPEDSLVVGDTGALPKGIAARVASGEAGTAPLPVCGCVGRGGPGQVREERVPPIDRDPPHVSPRARRDDQLGQAA